MAISTSFSNFFSFLSPQSNPQQQKPHPPLLYPFPSNPNHRSKLVPLVLSRDERSSSISTSPPPDSMSSVVTSSLSVSNSMFLASPYNVQVIVEDDEPEERLLNRFRREVMRAGIIQECKRRKFHENKQDEKKRKVREAAKRNRRNRFPRYIFEHK